MSDNWIILVPKNPFLRVDGKRLEETKLWLRSLGEVNSEVSVAVHQKPQFIDAGTNIESISCPHCNAPIENEFWGEWMSDDFDGEGFEMRTRLLPCCGDSSANLNQLRYYFAQAFGCCQVDGMNLSIGTLSGEQVAFAENLMGTELTVVYCHI